jgi:hypothetical protein
MLNKTLALCREAGWGISTREALVFELYSNEKREKPFTLSHRFLTLLRALQLLALACGEDQ